MRACLLASLLLLGGCDDDPAGEPAPDAAPADAQPDAGGGGGGGGGDAGVRDEGVADALAPDAALAPAERLAAVPETEAWALPGLGAEAHVVFTELGVPHLYARDRADLGRVLGFIVARDRYFVMDLQRRLGLGTLSALLGDVALENDIESRMNGITFVTDRLVANLSPEMGAYLDAVAAGINAYIAAVDAGQAPPPSELRVARALLGVPREVDLMHPWDRRDLAAMVAVVMYETTFETGDVGRQRAADSLAGLFRDPDTFEAELRRTGYLTDIWDDVSPHLPSDSVPGLGVETAAGFTAGPLPMAGAGGRPGARRALPASVLALADTLEAFEHRLGRDRDKGFGSNAWAVAGSATADGASLLAGDGHLQLSAPPLMYQIGLDTRTLGDGPIQQAGLLLTGLPVLAVGTNGRVAWSQVNPVLDITDWYQESLRLDADGRPDASFFRGEWRPLVAVDEAYAIANVPALDSVGRDETWTRYTTFDGRFLVTIEGRPVGEGPGPGEAVVMTLRGPVVPTDLDASGTIDAISFDYAAFDATNYLDTLDRLGFVDDVAGFRETTRGLVGSGLFSAAGDQHGDILFSSYQAVPCRGYLARDAEGRWLPGADPTQLLDGTTYGGFRLPMRDGVVDEAPGAADPQACVVPFAAMPQAVSPARGYVQSANNDPGGLTNDGRLDDDPWYIGGPWYPTRGNTIDRDLQARVAAGGVDVAGMSALQSDDSSRLGEMFVPALLGALEAGRRAAASDGELDPASQRLAGLYRGERAALDEVATRLAAWGEAGAYDAGSGVETFYHQPDAQDRANAIATMVFNAWLPRFIAGVFDDERIPGWRFSTSRTQVRALRDFLAGRGPENPGGLASWYAATGESIFFDRLGTAAVETADEIMLAALVDALAFLRSEPAGPGEGGFGTADMEAWLWGLRHYVRFESLLGGFLGADSGFDAILAQFNITPRQVPLTTERLDRDDPRSGLAGFPRPGDNWGVDGANPGLSGTRFSYGSGPVMRMVIALKGGDVDGVNIIPGGQSALTDSPHFADQTRLWLGNQTIPLRFSLDQVLAGAEGRAVFRPAP